MKPTLLATPLLAQEGQATFELRSPPWTETDIAIVIVAFLFVLSLVIFRRSILESLISRRQSAPWAKLRRWLPIGMVVAGWLFGFVANWGGAVPLMAWAMINLPAVFLSYLVAGLLFDMNPFPSALVASLIVWLVWFGLLRWTEAKLSEGTSLSIPE